MVGYDLTINFKCSLGGYGMTNKADVIGMLKRVNLAMLESGKEGKIVLSFTHGKISIYQGDSKNCWDSIIVGMLTKNEAYHTLYAMARALEMK
jgi:hypothetical protein